MATTSLSVPANPVTVPDVGPSDEPGARDPIAAKRAFYRQASIAATYEEQRFGGPSGARVNEREIALIEALLPPGGRTLDLGCGTGRLSRHLVEHDRDVVMLDVSASMLARAVATTGAPAILGDAFALPFAAESFDAIVALRIAFHFADLDALVGSAARLLRPGGRLIFDTYRWTPRALLALASGRWGGKIYVHDRPRVDAAARSAGLTTAAGKACFLFSPYLYRLLPLAAVRGLDLLETTLPDATRARVFWALERPSDMAPAG